MKEKLEILFSKIFCRLRHKTQLFNGNINDHYHTRMQHTFEVEAIALIIADKIIKSKPEQKINLDKISSITLLHDIGHTPFGHAGERALHEILSSSCGVKYGLPDFLKIGINCGFKHNINSGLLYRENCIFDNIDETILEGIVKHTKLRYNDDKLDYGVNYVFSGTNIKYDASFKFIETFIVYWSDEIAQVCSDYLDINLNASLIGKEVKFDCKPFNEVTFSCSEPRIYIKEVCNFLIMKFVECYLSCTNFENFKSSYFAKIIDEFNVTRSDYIKNDKFINKYDTEQRERVIKLFSFYYNNPEELPKEFYKDFLRRIKRYSYRTHSIFKNEIEFLSPNIKEIKEFISKIQCELYKKISNNYKKDIQMILKVYIRSIAIYIAKMTDNYAIHKMEKYRIY